jgi:hypothetical protein
VGGERRLSVGAEPGGEQVAELDEAIEERAVPGLVRFLI